MYSRGSNNGYGQDQPYPSQLPYASQSFGAAAMMGGVDGRAPAAVTVPPLQRYGGEYGSVYGSATQQGSATAAFEGRSNYGSSMHESPKFGANDYISSSSRGYGLQVDKLYSERTSEYPSVERRQYGDHHIAYPGRDKPSETTHRYADSVTIGHEHQSKLYDDLEQATSRQEEMLNTRALQSVSIEGGARQADYLASRAAIRHPVQDPIAYGGRLDHELRSLSMLTGQSFMGNHTASILGAAPRGNLDELIYSHDSSTPGYGVNLPSGRNYGIGKGLLSVESDYPTSMLGRAGHLIVNDRNNGRDTYVRDLERRGKLEREIEREREKDRLRERERDRERDRERLREREREQREREREKDRERERERRERDWLDHKRRLELKREPTPVRTSRDRQTLSFAKDGRSMRRESPRHDLLNRLHSPVKEKRREYSCKVFPYSFVEAERDYLSLDKRYPRLYISPECSKVVVHWPKSNLQLSLYTPVSFEHDFVEADTTEKKESPSSHPTVDMSGPGRQKTVWNAKIILISGLGQNAQADLSSERTYDDRIPHFCNLLKFAVLRKNNSLMAIGGPWDPVDGGEPSVDESSLVQTALRYANDGANLDLKSCQHWNRFLEIHYDRIGKDGHCSHKEITVLYVPDLSCCLPSLDSWRERWVKYKKAVSEREHLHALAKEVPGDKKEISKGEKKPVHPKDGKAEIVPRKKKETLSSEGPKEGKVKTEVQKNKEEPSNQSGHDNKKERDVGKMKGKTPLVSEEGMEIDKAAESNDVINTEGEKTVSELVPEGNPDGQALVATKTGKKKIIKRIVKRKVAKKKDATEKGTEQNDETEKVGATEGSCLVIPNADGKLDGPSSNPSPLNSLVKKRVVTKIVKAALEKDESSIREVKSEKEPESSPAFNEEVKEEDSNVVTQEVVSTKTTVKKKVVKRVPKRKATSPADKVAEDDLKGEKITQPESIKREHNEEAVDNQLMDISSKSSDSQKMGPHKKEETKVDEKGISGPPMEIDNSNQNVSSNDARGKSKEKKLPKDEKDGKNRVENECKSKTGKTTKEKKKSDEPPKHPGLILQTKGSKVSNVHSLSLSLDSLLNYTDTDIDESTFELSVFAESFNEMLQYGMGCRIFAFLQKLRIKFVANRNKAKRQREETSQKENENSSSKKRARAGNAKSNADVKSNEIVNKSSEDVKLNNAENKSSEDVENKTENKSSEDEDVENKTEGKSCEDVQSTKVENKMDNATENTGTEITEVPNQDNEKTIVDEIKSIEQADTAKVEDEIGEGPEEDPEEDEKMSEASPLCSPTKEGNNEIEKNAGDSIGQDVPPVIAQNEQQDAAKQASEAITSVNPSSKKKLAKVESKPKEARTVVDKELLQAFRYFDRNRAGYIRVEDLRLIIHNLGKFLSHRDVKELVQSALLESSTGRDDKILYEKLVKVPDVILN